MLIKKRSRSCKFSKLYVNVLFFHIKCVNKVINKAFDMLFAFLREFVPNRNEKLAELFYALKMIPSGLGVFKEKIDACLNECVLY